MKVAQWLIVIDRYNDDGKIEVVTKENYDENCLVFCSECEYGALFMSDGSPALSRFCPHCGLPMVNHDFELYEDE